MEASTISYNEWKQRFAHLKKTATEAFNQTLSKNTTKILESEQKPSVNLENLIDTRQDSDIKLTPSLIEPLGSSGKHTQQPKIVPIAPITPITPKPQTDSSKEQLKATLEAPLIAFGLVDGPAIYLTKNQSTERNYGDDTDAKYWIDWWSTEPKAVINNTAERQLIIKVLDKLWTRWIIDVVLLVYQNLQAINESGGDDDSWVSRCIDPYFKLTSTKNPQLSSFSDRISWYNIDSILCVLANQNSRVISKDSNSLQSLVNLFATLVNSGATFPTSSFRRISLGTDSQKDSKYPIDNLELLAYKEYVTTACSIPDRLASLYQIDTLPHILRPKHYYSAMVLDITKNLQVYYDSCNDQRGHEFLSLIFRKLCRIGQSYSLARSLDIFFMNQFSLNVKDLAVSTTDPLTKLQQPSRSVNFLASVISSLPAIEVEKLWAAYLNQWCSSLTENARQDDIYNPDVYLWTIHVAKSFKEIWGSKIIESDHNSHNSNDTGDSIFRISKESIETILPQLMASDYPIALHRALIMGIKHVSPPNFQDNLLVLVQQVLKVWGQAHFVKSAPTTLIKSLTSLIILSVGNLSPKSLMDLTAKSDFSESIYRYFSSPTIITRIYGIIVAEAVTRKASRSMDSPNSNNKTTNEKSADKDLEGLLPVDPSEALDFGLDDIIEQGKKDAMASVRVSEEVEIIVKMRLLCLPLEKHLEMMTLGLGSGKSTNVISTTNQAKSIASVTASSSPTDDIVYERRPQSLVDPTPLKSDFVKPRKPKFIRQVLEYMNAKDKDIERAEISLEAASSVIQSADYKELNETCIDLAKKIVHLFNPGSDSKTLVWDNQRLNALIELCCRVPEKVVPFLCQLCFDRELNIAQREIILAAVASTSLRLSGISIPGQEYNNSSESTTESPNGIKSLTKLVDKVQIDNENNISNSKVVWKSRKLEIDKTLDSGINRDIEQKKRWARLAGPVFFFPLISQFEYRSAQNTGSRFDIRQESILVPKYLNTLAIIVYTAGASSHQIKMEQEFWNLVLSFRYLSELSEHSEILEILLFCLDVLVSSDRSLSTETLVREFGNELKASSEWITNLVDRGLLDPGSSPKTCRLLARIGTIIKEHQDKLMQRFTNSGDVIYL